MKRLLIVMLIVWLAPTVCVAQQGVLRGKVTETTSGLLPGVSVEACGSASSGECRSAVTDGWGYYLLDDLLVGTYTVTMSLPGFSSFVREGVEVLVGDAPYLHGQLTVGALAGEAMPPKENSLTANSPAKGVLGPSVGFWVFDGTAGQVVSVAASSDAFDPEAELLSPTGERLGSDDDSGPGTNALLTETLPATGRYEVRVRAVDGGTGAYRLAVRTVPEASLALNTQVAGALDDRSPVGRWTFDGTAGQVVSVAASSDAFDPEAELLSPTGKRLGSDDDSGPGTNALLTETLPATGRYEVRVHAVDGGAGAYHLAVRTVPTVRLAVDTPVAGALDDQAPLGLWTFAGTAGQVVNVSVASEVFAPFIELLLPTGEHLTADGNGGSGTNASFTTTLPVTGDYKVRVVAVDPGTGAYRLAVRTAPAAQRAVEAPGIVVVHGGIDSSQLEMRTAAAREIALDTRAAAMLGNETPVGLWTFAGTTGQVASVAVASEAFDPIVEVRSPTGERLWLDYDSGPGSGASLTEVLPVSGRYEVQVYAVADGAGAYRLAVGTVAKAHLVVDAPVASALDEKAPAGVWTFAGTAGQVVRVAAASEAFDPKIELRLPTSERLESDDDSGPGTNAWLQKTLPVTGRYEVWVRTVDGRTGAYRLAVDTVAEARLTANTPVASALDEKAPADVWTFAGTAGQVVRVAAASEAFDPKIELRLPTGERLESDDDSGPGTNAWLQETLPVTGRYEVWVRTVDGRTGAYRLAVDTVAEARLTANTPVAGALDNRAPVAVWGFDGAAGQVLRVAARSEDFAPAVELRSQTGERVWPLESGETGSDAWLHATLSADGRYRVWVSAAGGGTGPYQLAVRTSAPREVALDTHVTGELGEGGPVGAWGLTGTAGQSVSVAVGSEAFAPTVEVRSSSGERVPWDDTPAGGASTGQWTTLPVDGRYEVRVRAVDGGTGPYQVAVRTALALDMTEPAPIARITEPAVSEADVALLADGHRTFAFDLYQSLRSTTGNLFYSPHSLSLSFGMLAAGARGDTARQISDTFHLSLPPGVLHPAVNALDLALRPDAGNRGADAVPTGRAYELAIANALWSQTGSPALPAYRDILGLHYGAKLQDLDFRDDPNGARRRINDWVREHTDGHVPELLADGAIQHGTRFVLTNAVAFEARWRTSFDEWETTNRPFHLHDGGQVETPTMRGDIDVGYSMRDGHQIIDLPYKGGAAAMTVLLPDAGQFDQFERRLDVGLLGEAIASLEDTTVDLYMPIVEFEATVALSEMLAEMGMPDAFDPERANLSGINAIACPAQECLYVDVAAHKAFVSVDEEGTTAVAATGMGTIAVSGRPVLPTVRIDRPFVFLIRDVPTGTILFMGRVVDPR